MERAGSGLENIQLAWKEQEWLAPDLEELYNPDRIDLTLRTVSMLPEESIKLLKLALKREYNELKKEEVMALVAAHQEGYVTNNRLQQFLDTHALNSNKILSILVDKGYLESDGVGRGKKYFLSDMFKNNNDIDNMISEVSNDDLTFDEKRVLEYIIKNQYITTKLCVETFEFKKTKSVEIFNKLINLGKIKRIGSGSKTKYILK